ncbi:MAG TPA: hypothetical protein VFS32_12365 [Candidatus Limnocylindrales bacterium]|nr:hypothetical protein [Candidatus Limnocylindrales bacterium]
MSFRAAFHAATLLHAIIGFSGIAVGLQLAVALAVAPVGTIGPRDLGSFAIPLGLVLYGALDVVGAIGIWSRRSWGRWVAVAVDGAGIVVVGAALGVAGFDDLLAGGAALLAFAAVLAWLGGRGERSLT